MKPGVLELVGRDRDVELLTSLVANPPAVAVLVGEAGIGKSRLIDEVLSSPHLRSHRRLVSRRASGSDHADLRPLIDLLEGAAGLGARPRREVSGEKDLPVSAGLADPLWLRGLLRVLGELGPTVCVLEDLHEWEDRSIELLRPLVSGLPRNIALITSYRDGAVPRWSPLRGLTCAAGAATGVEHVFLGPLRADQVRRLAAAAVAPADVSAGFAEALWERTAGVPDTVVQTLSLVAVRAELVRSNLHSARLGLEEAGVPASVRDWTAARLRLLGEPALRILRAAAVLGTPGDAATLGTLCGLRSAVAASALTEALTAGLLSCDQHCAYRIVSPVIAEAIQGDITPSQRRLLHGRAARLLERDSTHPTWRLARHHLEAGAEVMWARCVGSPRGEAEASADPEAALRLVADLLPPRGLPASRRDGLAVSLAAATLRHRRDQPEVSGLLRRLSEDPDLGPPARGEVRRLLATHLLDAGDVVGWSQQLVAAAGDLASRPARAAVAMCQLSVPWVDHGGSRANRLWLERAAAAASQQVSPTAALMVRAAEAVTAVFAGERGGRRAMARLPWRATAVEERSVLGWAGWNAGLALLHTGHYEAARASLDEALRQAAELGGQTPTRICEAAALELAWHTGEWSGLEHRVREHLSAGIPAGGWTARAHLVMGRLLLARGQVDEAEMEVGLAREGAARAGIIPAMVTGAAWAARVRLALRQPAAAAEVAAQAVELAASNGIWVWAAEAMPPAIEALIACKRVPEATHLVFRFAAGVRGRDAPLARAVDRHCAGLLLEAGGDHGGAAAAFREAQAGFAELPHPHGAATASAKAGLSALAAGDGSGPELLLGALTLLDDLGATADAARVRRALRRHRVAGPRRAGRPGPGVGSALSPREAEVVALAADGLTNGEVGRSLFISPRTAEHHLGAAMRKLGVTSRRDLSRAIRSREPEVPAAPATPGHQ